MKKAILASGLGLLGYLGAAALNPFYPIYDSSDNRCYVDENTVVTLDSVDCSRLFEQWLISIAGRGSERCTQRFIDGDLRIAPQFLSRYIDGEGRVQDGPTNGVLGNDFERLRVYVSPNVEKTDSVTYALSGLTRVKDTIRDFVGEVKIKDIYHCPDSLLYDFYLIIADYTLSEDAKEEGSGVYRGIMGAIGYIADEAAGEIIPDALNDVADGYWNRTYVGTWQNCDNPAVVKRGVWGDYRLPFTFDFDIGDGEMIPNPKYVSNGWEHIHEEYKIDESGVVVPLDKWWLR
ncbi:MAG: hypothetical protein K2M88_09130 [Muribaculaceae bacterium]|nr:hypothetical protein [Muribaculaceae bacterium]